MFDVAVVTYPCPKSLGMNTTNCIYVVLALWKYIRISIIKKCMNEYESYENLLHIVQHKWQKLLLKSITYGLI